MILDQFFHDLQPKQTLNCQMATFLTVARLEKEDLLTKIIMKIGAFVQKLSMNKH